MTDDDLAAVAIEIPIMIALLDDARTAIAVIVPVTNHFASANDVAVTMAGADCHARPAHATPPEDWNKLRHVKAFRQNPRQHRALQLRLPAVPIGMKSGETALADDRTDSEP